MIVSNIYFSSIDHIHTRIEGAISSIKSQFSEEPQSHLTIQHAAVYFAPERHGLYTTSGQEPREGCFGPQACASALLEISWILWHVVRASACDG